MEVTVVCYLILEVTSYRSYQIPSFKEGHYVQSTLKSGDYTKL